MNIRGVDRLVSDYTGKVPGAAVAIIRDGKMVFERGYGMADLEAGVPVSPQTNFRLASLTKEFTATAIEILAERQRLSYDDPITRWLPSLPAYASGITIRQLLSHTAGLIDYEDLIPKSRTEQVSDDDVLHLLEATDHTLFPPGSHYQYSNGGFVLLGLIIERVTGESLGTFLKREAFDRAGMANTVMRESQSAIANRAFGYTLEQSQWIRRDQSVTSATRGDGAIYSSVADLARWDSALRNATVVHPETLRMAFTPAVATGQPGESYGFGWYVSTHRGRRMIWHTGDTVSFHNAIVRFDDPSLTVIVLTNRDGGDPLALAKSIADLQLP